MACFFCFYLYILSITIVTRLTCSTSTTAIIPLAKNYKRFSVFFIFILSPNLTLHFPSHIINSTDLIFAPKKREINLFISFHYSKSVFAVQISFHSKHELLLLLFILASRNIFLCYFPSHFFTLSISLLKPSTCIFFASSLSSSLLSFSI